MIGINATESGLRASRFSNPDRVPPPLLDLVERGPPPAHLFVYDKTPNNTAKDDQSQHHTLETLTQARQGISAPDNFLPVNGVLLKMDPEPRGPTKDGANIRSVPHTALSTK